MSYSRRQNSENLPSSGNCRLELSFDLLIIEVNALGGLSALDRTGVAAAGAPESRMKEYLAGPVTESAATDSGISISARILSGPVALMALMKTSAETLRWSGSTTRCSSSCKVSEAMALTIRWGKNVLRASSVAATAM